MYRTQMSVRWRVSSACMAAVFESLTPYFVYLLRTVRDKQYEWREVVEEMMQVIIRSADTQESLRAAAITRRNF